MTRRRTRSPQQIWRHLKRVPLMRIRPSGRSPGAGTVWVLPPARIEDCRDGAGCEAGEMFDPASFFIPADPSGRDLSHPHIVYRPGRCSPDGVLSNPMLAAHRTLKRAQDLAGAKGVGFEVAGWPVGIRCDGLVLLRRVTVLGMVVASGVWTERDRAVQQHEGTDAGG